MSRPRILVAHANDDCRKIYGSVLAYDGYGVDQASDVPTALALIASTHFDVVVSDLYLPNSGDECLIRILRGSASAPHIPVIILTGWTTEAHRNVATEMGAERFLPLPIRPRELLATVSQVIGESSESAVAAFPASTPTDQPIRNGI